MQNTKIEWTDHTFNPWEGCTKVSPGCANCYAENRNARFGGGTAPNWGFGKPRRRTSVANWNQPLKWDLEAAASGTRPRVFCASLADWLDDEVPIEWLADLLDLIRKTPNLDWLLLTKRPQNWRARVEAVMAFAMFSPAHHAMLPWLGMWHPDHDSGGGVKGSPTPPANVWIGTSVEDFEAARTRLHHLVSIPASVRFLSCEPLLGDPLLSAHTVDIPWAGGEARGGRDYSPALTFIHWVIVGGESGPHARPMHPDWARSIRDQCKAAEVAFHFKQWGEWLPCVETFDHIGVRVPAETPGPKEPALHQMSDGQYMARVGKKAAGRLLDGVEHNEFPGGAS